MYGPMTFMQAPKSYTLMTRGFRRTCLSGCRSTSGTCAQEKGSRTCGKWSLANPKLVRRVLIILQDL